MTTDYQILDEIALRSGTDKSSRFHNYMDAYAQFFAPLREKPIKFCEIGIYEGASVKLWEEYFPQAELHFLDTSFDALKYSSSRAHYHLGDQAEEKDLQQFIAASGGNFDIIVDDGGHSTKQQIVSFITLFPHINSKGVYIIEDLHAAYWQPKESFTTIQYLKTLLDDLNYIGARTGRASQLDFPPELLSELNIYRTMIRSITFFTSIVIIEKR